MIRVHWLLNDIGNCRHDDIVVIADLKPIVGGGLKVSV
jgi:hypothetical protein